MVPSLLLCLSSQRHLLGRSIYPFLHLRIQVGHPWDVAKLLLVESPVELWDFLVLQLLLYLLIQNVDLLLLIPIL